MIPLKQTLTGFCGIRDGLGRETITIDFEAETGGAQLVALTGRNGRGKSTILDNMTPYPVMPSRAGSDGLGAFSYYDEVYLPENHKELEWAMDGVRYRSHLVIRMNGKRRTEAYLHWLSEKGWIPMRLPDGTVSDGRMDTYSRCVEGIAGSATTFFSTAFSAQQRRQLSSYRNGEIKSLLADLLRLDAVRAWGERATEVQRLLRAGLQTAQQQVLHQRQQLVRLAAERGQLADTSVRADVARQNRNVAAARLDAKRTALAAVRADQALAATHEARHTQLLAGRTATLAERQRAIDALDTECRREGAAFDEMAERHAQRASHRETILASLRAQRTTLQASLEQVRHAERAARRLPRWRTVVKRRAALLEELHQSLAGAERVAADLRLAQSQRAAIEREAGQAALKAQELRQRFMLTAEVPCAGMSLQSGCKLLADAHTAHALLPDASAAVARLNAAHTRLDHEIAGLRQQAGQIAPLRAAVARAEARLARSRERLAGCERLAARCALLAQSGSMLTEVEARLAAHTQQCIADAAEEEKEYGAQRRKIAELNNRRQKLARPCEVVQRIDALLADFPAPFNAQALTQAVADCEQASARLQAAEQAQLEALRGQERARELARQEAQQRRTCEAQERRIQQVAQRLEQWSLLNKALGNDGIIALAIDDAGPELSHLANQLLLACYGPRFSLSIQTQLATAKGELREGFDITVHDAHSNATKSVTKMSGGERIWINECLTRAMALYLVQADGPRYATLFSDEADGAFDAQHKRRFMAMKREVLRIGGYAQEYFISHTPELAEMADTVIDLERYAT